MVFEYAVLTATPLRLRLRSPSPPRQERPHSSNCTRNYPLSILCLLRSLSFELAVFSARSDFVSRRRRCSCAHELRSLPKVRLTFTHDVRMLQWRHTLRRSSPRSMYRETARVGAAKGGGLRPLMQAARGVRRRLSARTGAQPHSRRNGRCRKDKHAADYPLGRIVCETTCSLIAEQTL